MNWLTISPRTRYVIQMAAFIGLIAATAGVAGFAVAGNWRATGIACIVSGVMSALSITFSSTPQSWSRYALAVFMLLNGTFLIFN